MDDGAFMAEGLQKDSTLYAGYEPELKSESGPGKGKAAPAKKKKKGLF